MWTIDQKQLTLLCDWPTFFFGNAMHGYNSFTLAPRSPDLGSYWLAQSDTLYPDRFTFPYPYSHGYDIVAPALSIRVQQTKRTIAVDKRLSNSSLHLSGACALWLQIMWRYGELIETGTPAHDFLDALYRFVGLSPDPPGEFNGFSAESPNSRGFWGVEIRVERKPAHERRR